MAKLLASIFPNQEIPPETAEGLPFWLFWFMLCVILLLLAFIFLRDKDLRKKLNMFFMGFKKKIKKIRLQQMLKREQQKIKNILLELGRTAWSQNIKVPSSGSLSKQILRLEEQIGELGEEKKESISKIEELNKDFEKFKKNQDRNEQEIKNKITPVLQDIQGIKRKEKDMESEVTQKHFVIEETAKKITLSKKELIELENNAEMDKEEKKSKTKTHEDSIKEWQEKKNSTDAQIKDLVKEKTGLEGKARQLSIEIDELNQKTKDLEAHRKQETKKFQKEIREWEKTKDKKAEKIKSLEEEKNPFFKSLGRLANDNRLKNEMLSLYYSKIDRSEKRIKNLEKQIKEET
jgi:chromosome segregation ATPase